MTLLLLELIRFIGVSIGIGASTVLTTQWLAATADQKISPDEQRLVSLVHLVSRVGFLLALLAHGFSITLMLAYGPVEPSMFDQIIFMFLAIIFITVSFHNYDVINTNYSFTVQTATWFALGLLLVIGQSLPVSLLSYMFAYVLFTIFAVFLLEKVRYYNIVTHSNQSKE